MAYSRPPLTLGPDSETTGNKAEATKLVLYLLECQGFSRPSPFTVSLGFVPRDTNSCRTLAKLQKP